MAIDAAVAYGQLGKRSIMAVPGTERHALYALHIVHVSARMMAYERAEHAKLADIFDWAEIMPAYIDAKCDRSKAFRDALIVMTSVDPRFGWALNAFDAADVPRWHGEDALRGRGEDDCPSA